MLAELMNRHELAQLVFGEQMRLEGLYGAFREAYRAQDMVAALYRFEHFRTALERHQRWEEESLFEEFDRLADEEHLRWGLEHHRGHQKMLQLCNEVLELLARNLLVGGSVTRDIERRLCVLEELVGVHDRAELEDVAIPLDRQVSGDTLRMIEDELDSGARVPDTITAV